MNHTDDVCQFKIKLMKHQTVKIRHYKDVTVTSSPNLNIVELLMYISSSQN